MLDLLESSTPVAFWSCGKREKRLASSRQKLARIECLGVNGVEEFLEAVGAWSGGSSEGDDDLRIRDLQLAVHEDATECIRVVTADAVVEYDGDAVALGRNHLVLHDVKLTQNGSSY